MEKHLPALKKCYLFHSMSDSDILHILSCFNVSEKSYKADSYIYLTHDIVNHIGIILKGQIEIVKETLAGNRHIVADLSTSDLFGETIACTAKRISPVIVHTKTDCKVVMIPYENITHTCTHNCGYHTKLIQNMLTIIAEKNMYLNRKLELISLKGMREKIASYLCQLQEQTNSYSFDIPFNRNELAEYLNVSRTSMSRELAKMKEDEILDYHLNHFRILSMEKLMNCMQEPVL